MNLPTTACPGQTAGTASVPSLYSAAPGHNGAAARQRPRRQQRTRPPWKLQEVVSDRCHLHARPGLPVTRQRKLGLQQLYVIREVKRLEKEGELDWMRNAGDHLGATGSESVQWCHQEFFGPKSKIPSVQGRGGRRSFTIKTSVCVRTLYFSASAL